MLSQTIKKYIILIFLLLISLFIYLFYRVENTLIIQIFIKFFSIKEYTLLRQNITHIIPLNNIIIYSLPEGLWVFCITVTSKNYILTIGYQVFKLIYLPLLFSIGLEICQCLHLTNGYFDFLDIGIAILFWFLGLISFQSKSKFKEIFKPLTRDGFICIFSYAIVYLAHVLQ